MQKVSAGISCVRMADGSTAVDAKKRRADGATGEFSRRF